MKKTARILFLFLLLSLTVMLASCGGGGEKDKTYKVMVSPTAGATVTSENPVTVREGEDAVFTVTLDEAIEVARTHDNVMLDLCDIHRHSGIVDKMVEGVGADKVLFGTDIPWYDPSYCLGSILFSHISDEDKYKVIYGNAKKIADRFRK